MSELICCSVCGRVVGGVIPKGGDGSMLKALRHKRRLYDHLANAFYVDWCPGSNRLKGDAIEIAKSQAAEREGRVNKILVAGQGTPGPGGGQAENAADDQPKGQVEDSAATQTAADGKYHPEDEKWYRINVEPHKRAIAQILDLLKQYAKEDFSGGHHNLIQRATRIAEKELNRL
jgi:hypothetical protein